MRGRLGISSISLTFYLGLTICYVGCFGSGLREGLKEDGVSRKHSRIMWWRGRVIPSRVRLPLFSKRLREYRWGRARLFTFSLKISPLASASPPLMSCTTCVFSVSNIGSPVFPSLTSYSGRTGWLWSHIHLAVRTSNRVIPASAFLGVPAYGSGQTIWSKVTSRVETTDEEFTAILRTETSMPCIRSASI